VIPLTATRGVRASIVIPSFSTRERGIEFIIAPVSTTKRASRESFSRARTCICSPALSSETTWRPEDDLEAVGALELRSTTLTRESRAATSTERASWRCVAGTLAGSSVKWTLPCASTQR
jgi:hypothetical protein